MTKSLRSHLLMLTTLACALGGAVASTLAMAANNAALTEARTQYQSDVQFCRSPENVQTRANCMKEAQAAYDEARWKARGRAESPRATNTPDPHKIISNTTFPSPSLASGTGAARSSMGSGTGSDAAAADSSSPRSDRQ
jgi:hypothetical protein